jgi:hypothetical protein
LNSSDLVTPKQRANSLFAAACFTAGNYNIEVYTAVDRLQDDWEQFAKLHDHRFCKAQIGICEKSVLQDFGYFYVVVKQQNETVALFYFQTLLIRQGYYPDFSNLSFAARNLYCLISTHNYQLLINGHIFMADFPGAVCSKKLMDDEYVSALFDKVVAKVKRICDSSIFIIKDVHPIIHEAIKHNPKYKLMPDDVLMEMNIPSTWENIEDYVSALSKKYAVRATKIEQSLSQFDIEELDEVQITKQSVVLQRLYMNVMSKSSFKPGVLNMNYFAQMKAVLQDNFRVWVWKLNNEIVGFTSYLLTNDSIELYYIGIDYKVNKTYHLYQCMLQRGITDAIAMQRKTLKLGRTAYEAKAIIGAKPVIKCNYFHISNPILRIGYKYAADYFVAENSTNWQVRNPFR